MLMETNLLSNGNTLLSSSHTTKPESPDPEIEKIAQQIKEVNARKMLQTKQTVVITATSKKSAECGNGAVACEDWTSIQGQFGWVEIGKALLPYIMREGEKYVCQRMTHSKLFYQYSMFFSDEIWEYFPVKMRCITAAEAHLLNEINREHCDFFYGRDEFTQNDRIYPLRDALESYQFLTFCYYKVTKMESTASQRCGFIKIDKASVVPYVLLEGKKVVPLFYFEGDCEYLEKYAIDLKGWDLTYLKFVCKLQGIRRPLYDKDLIEVVDLENMKNFFLPGTEFEPCWEIECVKSDIFRKPTRVPKNAYVQSRQSRKLYNIKTPSSQMRPTTINNPHQKQPSYPYHSGRSTYNPSGTPPQYRMQQQYQTNYSQSNQTNQNCQPMNRPPGVQVTPMNLPNNGQFGSRCYQIPEVECQNNSEYFLNVREVDGKMLIGCINMEPFNPTTLLVSLEELASSLFETHINIIKNVVNALCLDIYRPNREQTKVLKLPNTLGLIRLDVLMENFPQIKYMLSST